MSVAAIIAALGGAQGLITLAQTFASTAFRIWQMAGQVAGNDPIPTWDEIKTRAENESTNIDQDSADIKRWLDTHKP